MGAIWRWLFICTGLGSLMNNAYWHRRKGNVWICPRVGYNERGFSYGLSLCLLHQNRSSCSAGFKAPERIKGRSSPYISFPSIIHWWGLCTITWHLNILKNTSWESGVFHTPAWSVRHCWGLLLSSGCCLDSASRWALLPNSRSPSGSGAICDSSRYLIPGFSCIIQPRWAVEGKAGKVNSYPSPPNCWGGLANHRGLSPA